jgi:peptidoglycan/LPS O-acetylase OafA/YrhL
MGIAGAQTVSSTKLTGIQALRGIAAAAVVLCHAARHVDKAYGAPGLVAVFQPGHAGVDLFFVISGFIILTVHRSDVGHQDRLKHYLGRRINRVVPLYWIALATTVGMSLAGGHAFPSLPWFAWCAALLPTTQEPLLGIAWTLQFEMLFYTAFAVLILNRRVGFTVLAAWFGWMVGASMFGAPRIPAALYDSYGMEFFLGMGAALAVRHRPIPAPYLVAAAGAVLLLVSMGLESAGAFASYGIAARTAYGIPAALLVLGIAGAERAGQLRVPAWLDSAGGVSYSIYLFQFVFIGAAWQVWVKTGLDHRAPPVICFLVLAAAGLVGGYWTGRLVERPLLSLSRRRRPAQAGEPLTVRGRPAFG